MWKSLSQLLRVDAPVQLVVGEWASPHAANRRSCCGQRQAGDTGCVCAWRGPCKDPRVGAQEEEESGVWVTGQGLLVSAGFLGAVLSLTFPGGFWLLSSEGRIHEVGVSESFMVTSAS